jgi:Flp pilus assembly protein TadG
MKICIASVSTGSGLRGAVAVELSLILPALLVVVLGLMDVGRLIWTQTTLDRAVESAARCAAVNTVSCGSTSATQTYAAGQAFGLAVATAVFTATTATCGANVSVTMPFAFIIPWLTTANITLDASACYPT